jgi:hypothetical protein
MRILIFHEDLTKLTGGEVNTRDWALGLKARGHKVVVFTHRLGTLAEEIRNLGVAVVNDPSSISDVPDIMLGFGVHSVAALAARFPESPIIQVAQYFDHWTTYPCPVPQVVLHIAVDEINAEMLVNEFGTPRDRVRIVYNAVDLTRLPARKQPLSAKPARAFVFAKQDSGYTDVLRAACASRNIQIDFAGHWIGRPIDNPLAVTVNYDIVFGSARTAIEGAVGGAAVIVADYRGFAGLLTTANLEHFRKNNFGRELLTRPFDIQAVCAEIDAYDPADATAVSQIMNDSAGLDRQLDRFESIFEEAIGNFNRFPPTVDETRRALSRYLTNHLPRVTDGDQSPRHVRFRPLPSIDERMSAMEARISSALERTSDERMKAMAAQIAAAVERTLATNEGNKLAIAHQEYADALKAHGDLDGAIRAYTRSIEVSRPNTALYYLRGIARLENGDNAGAVADFDAGLILEPDNETLKSLRAQAIAPRTA